MEYWETEFCNKRKTSVEVQERGQTLLTLAPGETKWVESNSAKTSYAAWFRITFKEDGKVELEKNPAWVLSNVYPGQLILEILNIDGNNSETFYDGKGEPIVAYKGIPRYAPIEIWDSSWNFVAKLEIKLVEQAEKEGDYVVRKCKLEQVKTLRSKTEIDAIKRRLVREAKAKAAKEVALKFRKRF